MDLSRQKIAVIGGGIGGFAAASALRMRGARVTIYEKAQALTEVGAGLQISANGQVVLRALGALAQDPPQNATVSEGTRICSARSGGTVTQIRSPRAGPTWYLHRADVLSMLVQRAEALGVDLVLGRVATPGTVDADLIVAADGVRSLWRTEVDGPDRPTFTSQVAWRALIPNATPVDAQNAVLTTGFRAHMVSYPLRQGALVNLVGVEERSSWTNEGWQQEGDPFEFQQRFADFGGPLKSLISKAETVHVWALFARPMAHRWYSGRIVLLGDAAHPTLPFMAQGACLALEDAWVLAQCLNDAPDVQTGLQHYQTHRQPRARKVMELAKGNARRFHLGWPLSVFANAALAVGGGFLAERLEWLYGFDVTNGSSQP